MRASSGPGVTSVLDDYWSKSSVKFPFPAMASSGDRMAFCWAVLGKAPDLRIGTGEQPTDATYQHACQGLDLRYPRGNDMPATAAFHTCLGSNQCKGQGGCGFVQLIGGKNNCIQSSQPASAPPADGCGPPESIRYSAPADNACRAQGGCAVPISASQLYPTAGKMQLYDITGKEIEPIEKPTLKFEVGDSVYETAWKAYCEVLKSKGECVPDDPPEPDILRVALPPST